MKKIASVLILFSAAFCAPIFGADAQPAPTPSDIVLLKQRIAQLEAQLKDMQLKYANVAAAELQISAKLREENRALRKQIRVMKRAEMLSNVESVKSSRASASEDSQEAQERRAERQQSIEQKKLELAKANAAAVEKAKAAAAAKSEVRVEKIENEAPQPAKSDSIWDNMFPF